MTDLLGGVDRFLTSFLVSSLMPDCLVSMTDLLGGGDSVVT